MTGSSTGWSRICGGGGLRKKSVAGSPSSSLMIRGGGIVRILIRRAADSVQRGVTKTTKNGRARFVDADPALLGALKRLRATKAEILIELAKPGVYIFGNDAGELRNPKRITDIRWRRIEQAHKKLGEDAFPRIPHARSALPTCNDPARTRGTPKGSAGASWSRLNLDHNGSSPSRHRDHAAHRRRSFAAPFRVACPIRRPMNGNERPGRDINYLVRVVFVQCPRRCLGS